METNNNELLKMLRLVQYRKGLFVAVALLITSVVIGYSFSIPKKFRADSTVFIEKNVITNLVKGLAVSPEMGDRIRVLKYALLSREIVSRVLDDVDAERVYGGDAEKQDLISELQRRTRIQIKSNGGLFIVSLIDQDPQFAKDYINTLIRTYVEENIFAKREESYGANRFLDEQIALFKNKLDLTEDAIIQFRRSHDVYLGNDESSQVASIKGYLRQIDQIELEIITLAAKRQLLEKQLKGLDPTVALFSEKRRSDSIALLDKQLQNLLLTYTDNYPEVVQLKAEIEILRRQREAGGEQEDLTSEMKGVNPLHQETMQEKLAVEAEVSSLRAKKGKLQQMVQEREEALRDVPEKKKELDRLTQERDSARKIYEELLLRLGQSEVSKQMEIGDKSTTFRIVDPAILPKVPVSPNMVRMILLAIAAGLGGGFGVVMLLEKSDGTIKDVIDLKTYGVRVLAQIPSIADQQTVQRRKRRDLYIYLTAACYGLAVLALFAYESLYRLKG